MSQNNGDDHGTRKKLDLPLNQPITAKILKEKPYEGENRYGKYFLWSFEIDGEDTVYFPDKETHEKLIALSLKVGDVIVLTRTVTQQNGKKVVSQVTVDVILRSSNGHSNKAAAEVAGDDGYRQLMEQSLRDAIEATRAVNTVQWSVDDIRGIALTIFIQRARG